MSLSPRFDDSYPNSPVMPSSQRSGRARVARRSTQAARPISRQPHVLPPFFQHFGACRDAQFTRIIQVHGVFFKTTVEKAIIAAVKTARRNHPSDFRDRRPTRVAGPLFVR